MRKILNIAQREYVDTVKTKTFLISLFIAPLFMIAVILFSALTVERSEKESRPAKKIAVTDLTGELSVYLEESFERYNNGNPHRPIVLRLSREEISSFEEKIQKGKLHGCFVIPHDALEGKGTLRYYSKTTKFADVELFSKVRRLVNRAIFNRRLDIHNLSQELIAGIRRELPVKQIEVGAEPGKKTNVMVMTMMPFFFMFLMFIGVMATSQHLLTSVIEEKNSRVMEVLLSAVTPFELMTGKFIGLAGVGFTIVAVWSAAGIGAATIKGMTNLIGGTEILFFVIYFILGFLLFSAILAACGAACNTTKEAQSLVAPFNMILVLPMVAWFYIAQHPQGTLSVVLSFIPPITPLVMILRIATLPHLPWFQILATIVLLIISVRIVLWASAKVFRVGVLMYGKPPSLMELLRWIRYK